MSFSLSVGATTFVAYCHCFVNCDDFCYISELQQIYFWKILQMCGSEWFVTIEKVTSFSRKLQYKDKT